MQNVLNPEALSFQPSRKLNARAPIFKPTSTTNPQAPIFTPSFTFNPQAPCWMPRSEEESAVKSPECTGADPIHEPDFEESPAVKSPAPIDICPIHESECEESTPVIEEELVHEPAVDHVDPQPSFHHINWLGSCIEEKSLTKPATSLAIAMSIGKLLNWEVEQLDESDFHKQICLRQAFRWVDPVVFTGDRQLLRTLSGSALENAAIGQTAKFYSDAGWWVGDHFEQHEDIPQWDPLDDNSYNPNDVVFNGSVIDGDIRLPEEHYQEANQEVSRRADRSAYDEKKARGPRKSPLSRVWNVSDISEYNAPLLNWADDVDEDDWDGANLYEELQRLRKDLHIANEDEQTESSPETPADQSRSPSLRNGDLQASSDEDDLSTPPSSVTSDQHDELEEDNNDIGMGTETACQNVLPDQASLLACMGDEDMEVANPSSSAPEPQDTDLINDDETHGKVQICEDDPTAEIATTDDSDEEAPVIDTGTVIIHRPIKNPACLELYIWTAPITVNLASRIPSATSEGQNTPIIRSKSAFTLGHTPTTASGIIQHMRQCSRRQGMHSITIGKPTTAAIGITPVNAAGAIERVRDITRPLKQEDRGMRKAWAWVKGCFDGRGST